MECLQIVKCAAENETQKVNGRIKLIYSVNVLSFEYNGDIYCLPNLLTDVWMCIVTFSF